jgi:uncharacterized protein (TIGR00730 family)
MHERKALMADLSDGFAALPGGLGTLEELAEITTWAQLGLHRKPVGLLDPLGFYAQLLGFLDHMVAEGFVTEANRRLLATAATASDLLDQLTSWQPVQTTMWSSGAGADAR